MSVSPRISTVVTSPFKLLELAVASGWGVFLLGGEPGVAETAADRLVERINATDRRPDGGPDHLDHRQGPRQPSGALDKRRGWTASLRLPERSSVSGWVRSWTSVQ